MFVLRAIVCDAGLQQLLSELRGVCLFPVQVPLLPGTRLWDPPTKAGPGSNHTLRKCASRRVLVPAVVLAAVTVFMLIAVITIAALAELLRVEKSKPPVAAPGPPAVPCCPDGWIGYRGKCYYFSETDGNWTYSQSQCSALNASLAAIDSEQEKWYLSHQLWSPLEWDFHGSPFNPLPPQFLLAGYFDREEVGGSWNGQEQHFKEQQLWKDFLLRYKGFLDRWIGLQREPGQPWRWPNGTEFDNRFPIRGGGDCVFLSDEDWFGSSRCRTWRRWICSKPDARTMGKG